MNDKAFRSSIFKVCCIISTITINIDEKIVQVYKRSVINVINYNRDFNYNYNKRINI